MRSGGNMRPLYQTSKIARASGAGTSAHQRLHAFRFAAKVLRLHARSISRPSPRGATMSTLPSTAAPVRPIGTGWIRFSLTYILPSLAVFYVVLSGLWLVPDSFAGMYG